jgi:hypothetical protein
MSYLEAFMSKELEEEKELLGKYRKMTPINRLNLLSNARIVLSVQESTRQELIKEAEKALGIPAKPEKGRETA